MDVEIFIYQARVVRVIDGDTAVFEVDHGMRIYSEQSIRVAGVNSPELRQGDDAERVMGAKARDFAKGWVESHSHHEAPDDWPFFIRTEKDRQSFNRYVGEVWCRSCGSDLAESLVLAGHAVNWPDGSE